MSRHSVAVVGAGIAGLTAAWTLTERHHVDVVVLEGSPRAGGKLHTEPFAGHPVDCGADAFLVRVPDAVDLCRELGLDDELVAPATRHAFLLRDATLRPFPDGLVLGVPTDLDALARSGLVSDVGVQRARSERSRPAEPHDGDLAVGPWIRDRVGDEVFETLVEPLLSGISAGDADRLSLQVGAAQLAPAARAGGSLVDHLAAQRAGADLAAPVFNSLRDGTGRLVAALTDRLGDRLRRDSPVTSLRRSGTHYSLTSGGGLDVHEVDGVVLAVPAPAAAVLVDDAPETRRGLTELEYASVAVVTVALRRSDVSHPLDGSGFLVPRTEGMISTACSWGSSKWPHWADEDVVVLRVSVGRHGDERGLDLGDSELVATVLGEVAPVLGIAGTPVEVRVARWRDALPQYRPGHLDRVAGWEAEIDRVLPGVALAGAATRGLGIPACVASGRRAAAHVVATLGAG